MTSLEDDDPVTTAVKAWENYPAPNAYVRNEINIPVTLTIPLWVAGEAIVDLQIAQLNEDSNFSREKYWVAAGTMKNALREYARTHLIPKIKDHKEDRDEGSAF